MDPYLLNRKKLARKINAPDLFDFIDHLVEVEGIQVTKTEVLIGKIKVMGANLVRVFLYKFLRDK